MSLLSDPVPPVYFVDARPGPNDSTLIRVTLFQTLAKSDLSKLEHGVAEHLLASNLYQAAAISKIAAEEDSFPFAGGKRKTTVVQVVADFNRSSEQNYWQKVGELTGVVYFIVLQLAKALLPAETLLIQPS